MLVMFYGSKQELRWLSLKVYFSLNLPYPSGPQQQPGTSKVTQAFPQMSKPSFPSCPRILFVCFFDKEYYGATNPFQWLLNCLGPCSCQCLTHKLPPQCKQQVAQTQLLRAQYFKCLVHHLEAQAVLQTLWKPSEVKGETSWQSRCDSWFQQSVLNTPANSWAADTAAQEPLARSLTFPDEVVCPGSWIRVLEEASHNQIQEVFKTLINKHFSLLKAWILSQGILSFEMTTQSFKCSNHSSWNPTSLCRNFSLIKTQ